MFSIEENSYRRYDLVYDRMKRNYYKDYFFNYYMEVDR